MVEVKKPLAKKPRMDVVDPVSVEESQKTTPTKISNGNGIATDDEDPSPPPSPYKTRAYRRLHESNTEEKDRQSLEIQKQHEKEKAIARTPRKLKKAKRTLTSEELELEEQRKEEEKRRKKEEREAAAQARREQKEREKEATRKAREERICRKQEKEEETRRAKEEKQRLAEENKHQEKEASDNNEFHGPRSLSASTSALTPAPSNIALFRSSLPAFVQSSPPMAPKSSPDHSNPSITNAETPTSPSLPPINQQDCDSPKSRPNSTKRVLRPPRRRRDIRSCLNPMNDSDDEFLDDLMFDATNEDMDIRPTWDSGAFLTPTELNMDPNAFHAPRILQKSIEYADEADEPEVNDPEPAELLPSRSYCCIM